MKRNAFVSWTKNLRVLSPASRTFPLRSKVAKQVAVLDLHCGVISHAPCDTAVCVSLVHTVIKQPEAVASVSTAGGGCKTTAPVTASHGQFVEPRAMSSNRTMVQLSRQPIMGFPQVESRCTRMTIDRL